MSIDRPWQPRPEARSHRALTADEERGSRGRSGFGGGRREFFLGQIVRNGNIVSRPPAAGRLKLTGEKKRNFFFFSWKKKRDSSPKPFDSGRNQNLERKRKNGRKKETAKPDAGRGGWTGKVDP